MPWAGDAPSKVVPMGGKGTLPRTHPDYDNTTDHAYNGIQSSVSKVTMKPDEK